MSHASPSGPAVAGQEPKRKKVNPGRLLLLCPVRHALLLLSVAAMGGYFCFRENRALMDFLAARLARPCHRFMGRLFASVPFSVAELVYALLIGGLIAYLVRAAVLLIRGRGNRATRVYKTVVTLLTAGGMLYAGFCLLWGVLYYAESFSERAGLEAGLVDSGDLAAVTAYFVDVVNENADQIPRDAAGCFAPEESALFDRSLTLYEAAARRFPSLDGPPLRAKPMVFSRFMSQINFTGFFFPFTGEANLNVDTPMALLPATIAHELAHQRGVAGED